MYELQRSFLATFRPPPSSFPFLPRFILLASSCLSLHPPLSLFRPSFSRSYFVHREKFSVLFTQSQFNLEIQIYRDCAVLIESSIPSWVAREFHSEDSFCFFVPRERKKVIHCIHGDDDYKDASDVSLGKWNYSSNELQFFLRIEATLLLICART